MPDGFTDPATWYAGLAGVVIAAGALITDPRDRVLVVKPNYRDYWTVPGGVCEFGEAPQDGCARELTEELGLPIRVGRLLVADWSRQYGDQARPIMHFIFDGGHLADGAAITIQRSELDGYRFTPASELGSYLPRFGLARITGALTARQTGSALYLPHQVS